MSPARLFLIGFAVALPLTIISSLTAVIGSIALDLFKSDEGVFNVWHFYLFNPFLFALFAGIYALYARICRRPLIPLLVSIHFATMVLFALFVVYLGRERIDIPIPDWREQSARLFEMQATIFMIAKTVFALSQILFLVNLVYSYFRGRETERMEA